MHASVDGLALTLATLKSVACVAAKRDVRRKLKPLALALVCPRWLWSSGDSIAVKRGRRDVRKQCLCTLLESRSTAAPCCVAYGNARDGLPTTHGTFVNCTKRFLTRCCLQRDHPRKQRQTIQGSMLVPALPLLSVGVGAGGASVMSLGH